MRDSFVGLFSISLCVWIFVFFRYMKRNRTEAKRKSLVPWKKSTWGIFNEPKGKKSEKKRHTQEWNLIKWNCVTCVLIAFLSFDGDFNEDFFLFRCPRSWFLYHTIYWTYFLVIFTSCSLSLNADFFFLWLLIRVIFCYCCYEVILCSSSEQPFAFEQ